ncbi:MAG: hypothetical protein WCQ78_06250 [Actinomycetes bacterium]|jgi:F0F1-type ATP synthase assembly protein I|nr:hypothetical protein [Actinomycetota bacterium]
MATSEESAFWTIFSYLIAGLLLWGGVGLLADHLLKTHFLTLLGMAAGMAASLYLIWLRFVKAK